MRLHRHFTELKNLDLWLRHEASKLANTHTFLLKGMEKLAQKSPFLYVEILLFLLLISYRIPFLAKLSDIIGCSNIITDFSWFSFFRPWQSRKWRNLVLFVSFSDFFTLFHILGFVTGWKMKIMKNITKHLNNL